MVIFESEKDIQEKLRAHDQLISDCVIGKLGFLEFIEAYNNFYYFYALDGHESDDEELSLLRKYEERIQFHEQIATEILNKVCADDDALKQSYIEAGRFGSKEATERLKELVSKNA